MSSATATTPEKPAQAKRGWFGRNWKWAVPLSLLVLIVGGGLIFAWPLISPRFHPQYARSLEAIENSPEVVAKLGEPISPLRPFPGGRITTSGDRGEASFHFEVQGPKGTAAVSSLSRLFDNQWDFTKLEITFDDNERIDIAQQIVGSDEGTPKFDPNAKMPEVEMPNLPRNIDFELPPEATQ